MGSTLLFLFPVIRGYQDESFQVGLVLAVLFQSYLLFQGDRSEIVSFLDIGRMGCLTFMIIVAAANYIENSRHLGFEFWSVIDLLVLLIFSGLVVLQLNGLDISLWNWMEVILFYYSLGLYAQQRKREFG